ncbi:hypothetical protein KR009_009124 [Drosophila setifemur]|nr:hypothetical protein KR009_009124 [Drosophila setifemur]
MTGFLLRFLWPLALLQCIQARVPLPRFYGQDGAFMVNTEMKMPPRMDSKLRNALYYNMPVYKLIKPGFRAKTTTTTTTTTAAPISVSEYPSDLLEIARTKLGLKDLPSLEELGELIGTKSDEETIDYIRTLTSDDAGIALMKEYLDTLSFEDENVAEEKDVEDADNDNDDNNNMDNVGYDDLPKEIPSTPKSTEPENSLIERLGAFIKLWSGEVTAITTTTTPAPVTRPPAVSFQPVFMTPPKGMTHLRPLLVRQPMPYHYPIPLPPVMMPAVKPTQVPSTTEAPKPHLNTPKILEVQAEMEPEAIPSPPVAPHIRQLAGMVNIKPSLLNSFLEQRPKLAELAKRFSTLSFSQEQLQAMDSQVIMAIQKALIQDQDFKRLIEAAPTLK